MSHSSTNPALRLYGSTAPPPPMPPLRPLEDARSPHTHRPHPSPPTRLNTSQPSAMPMAIPNAARDVPPPPLPPPRYIHELSNGQDPGWRFGNRQNDEPTDSRSAPITPLRPGSSLLGGNHESRTLPEHPFGSFESRSNAQKSTYSSQDVEMSGVERRDHAEEHRTRPSLANFRLQSETQLGQRAVSNSAQAYDKQLLSKIGGPAAPSASRRSSSNYPNGSSHDHSHRRGFHKMASQLKPLSVQEHRHGSLDSNLSRWQSAPSTGLVSPGFSLRSPLNDVSSIDSAISPRQGSFGQAQTPTNSTAPGFSGRDVHDDHPRQHRNSDDQGVFLDPEFGVEENRMRELNINDSASSTATLGDDYTSQPHHAWGYKGSLKRRASSPPSDTRDDRLSTATTASSSSHASNNHTGDFYQRRTSQLPTPTYSRLNQAFPSSLSSVNSSVGNASGWSFSLASSATTASYGSPADRLSPGALSPSSERDPATGPCSPFAMQRNAAAAARSPRIEVNKNSSHLRKGSEDHTTGNYWGDGRRTSRQDGAGRGVTRPPGYLMCECCPKKPKKFDTKDELRAHEMEKQYQCQYCPNRFKNKNEAERHQNSLHLRRHSWSCAALATAPSVFHPSTAVSNDHNANPSASSNETSAPSDVCGYCGMEFANPPNWTERTDHLTHVHKFGECNQAKKFFRADHFRQHLKHSHAGQSGKWTNVLENACMRDEPLPQPIQQQHLHAQPLPNQQQTIVVGAPPPVPPLSATGLM